MTTLPTDSSTGDPSRANVLAPRADSQVFDPTCTCVKCRRPLDADCVLHDTPSQTMKAAGCEKFLVYCPACVSGFRIYSKREVGRVRFVRIDLMDPVEHDAKRVRDRKLSAQQLSA